MGKVFFEKVKNPIVLKGGLGYFLRLSESHDDHSRAYLSGSAGFVSPTRLLSVSPTRPSRARISFLGVRARALTQESLRCQRLRPSNVRIVRKTVVSFPMPARLGPVIPRRKGKAREARTRNRSPGTPISLAVKNPTPFFAWPPCKANILTPWPGSF